MVKNLLNLSVYQVTIVLFFKPPDVILRMPPIISIGYVLGQREMEGEERIVEGEVHEMY